MLDWNSQLSRGCQLYQHRRIVLLHVSYGILWRRCYMYRWLYSNIIMYMKTAYTTFLQINTKTATVSCMLCSNINTFNACARCNWKPRSIENSCIRNVIFNFVRETLNFASIIFLPKLDINECRVDGLTLYHTHYSHNCHDDANCTNTKGSFYCTCPNGYSGDGVMCEGREC